MTDLEKQQTFEKEISYIKNEKIKQFVLRALTEVPNYFYEIPSSSTGRYHPSYALGEGGLVRHTKAAVGIAQELFRMEMMNYTEEQQDCVVAALILHDSYKSGVDHSKYSVAEHPIIAVEQFSQKEDLMSLLTDCQRNTIFDCIAHHMGQWIQNYTTKKEVLEKPKTKIANFTHLCDYIASRKCLEYNFNV